jgi:hypothetical protein
VSGGSIKDRSAGWVGRKKFACRPTRTTNGESIEQDRLADHAQTGVMPDGRMRQQRNRARHYRNWQKNRGRNWQHKRS